MRYDAVDFTFDATAPAVAPTELSDASQASAARCGPQPNQDRPTTAKLRVRSPHVISVKLDCIVKLTPIAGGAQRPGTLADCFVLAANHPDVPEPIRNLARDGDGLVRTATGHAAAELPANPVALRPFPRSCRRKAFATPADRARFFHLLQTSLALCGWLDLRVSMRRNASGPWLALIAATSRFHKRNAIVSFMVWCAWRGIRPEDVTTKTLLDYLEFLEGNTLDLAPWSTVLCVRRTWAYMQSYHVGWPSGTVNLPRRRQSAYATRTDLCYQDLVGATGLANRSLIRAGDPPPDDLAACFDFVAAQPEISPSFRRDAAGARKMLARLTGRDLGSLPTDPESLRPILGVLEPVRLKPSAKRHQNVASVTRSVLILCGCLSADHRKYDALGGAWAELLVSAKRHELHRPLAAFFRFCERRGLTPTTMAEDILDDYIGFLTTETLKSDPRQTAIAVRSAWQRMQKIDPSWPPTALALESHRVVKFRDDFPVAFYTDLNGYLGSLSVPHPRDPTYRQPMAPGSIRCARTSILRAATFLAESGVPVAEITGIAALVTPDRFERILLTAYQDAEGKWSYLAKQISINLLMAARRWVKPDTIVLTDLEGQVRSVRVIQSGRRRRDALAQFATPEARADLYDLPWRAFEQAEALLEKGIEANCAVMIKKAARLHEIALALAILLTQPIRIGNLVALDIGRHLKLDRSGRPSRFLIEAGEVKNAMTIEIFIPERLQEKVIRHLRVFRPELTENQASTALFPNKQGKSLQTGTIGIRIRELGKRQLGVDLTAHLLRHLAAERLFDDDPDNLYLAQRYLGHARPETTARVYAHQRTSAAQRAYAELIERDLTAARKPRNQSRRTK